MLNRWILLRKWAVEIHVVQTIIASIHIEVCLIWCRTVGTFGELYMLGTLISVQLTFQPVLVQVFFNVSK